MVMAFVRAADVGLSGTELKPEIDGNAAVLARLEAVRGAVAFKLGLCVDPAEAASRTPALPKIAFVSTPRNHRVADGQKIASTQIDLIARGVSMGRLHHACIVETLRRPPPVLLAGDLHAQTEALLQPTCDFVFAAELCPPTTRPSPPHSRPDAGAPAVWKARIDRNRHPVPVTATVPKDGLQGRRAGDRARCEERHSRYAMHADGPAPDVP